MGSVIGLDTLTSPVEKEQDKEESRAACSPFIQRTSTPILKRITKPFNNLLDSRRVAPSKNSVTPSPSKRFSTLTENNCGECYKKLSGKTVRLPDTQVRYHWKCLKCNGCTLPFEDTSFFIDPYKRVYHPNVSLERKFHCSSLFFVLFLMQSSSVLLRLKFVSLAQDAHTH